jgi:hypothetical protein
MASRTGTTARVALALGGVAALAYVIQRQRQERTTAPPSRVITIDRSPADLERLWGNPDVQAAVFGDSHNWTDLVSAQFREARPARWGSEMTLTVNASGVSGAIASAVPVITNRALQKLLHRFKALVEAGEIPTLSKNPAGRDRIIAAA